MSIKELLTQLVSDYQNLLNSHEHILNSGATHKVQLFSGRKSAKGFSPQQIITKAPQGDTTQAIDQDAWFVELYLDDLCLIRECATTLIGQSLKELEPILIGRVLSIVFAAGIGNLMSLKRENN